MERHEKRESTDCRFLEKLKPRPRWEKLNMCPGNVIYRQSSIVPLLTSTSAA